MSRVTRKDAGAGMQHLTSFYHSDALQEKWDRAVALTERLGLSVTKSELARRGFEKELDALIGRLEKLK